jgi:predicted aconitase with swiveling domain
MHRGWSDGKMELKGRIISRGVAEGEALTTTQPISFYGGVDPETSEILEKGHELQGKQIRGKILVFPTGKGSTVGSYTLYRLKKGRVAPAAIINRECETVVAVGAIISKIETGDTVRVENGVVTIKK